MQAIITQFKGWTNKLPSRIIAKTGSGKNKLVFSLTHAVGSDAQNHKDAAEFLKQKMGWEGELIQGSTKDGYVFVIKDDSLE